MTRRWRSPCLVVSAVLTLSVVGACQTPSSPPSPATNEGLAGPAPPASATSSRSTLLRRASSTPDGQLFPAKAGTGGHHHHGAPAPVAATTTTTTPAPIPADDTSVDAGVTDTQHQGHQP